MRDVASVDYVMGERRSVMSSGNPEPYAVITKIHTFPPSPEHSLMAHV